jgi:hypothetical protein
MLALVSDRFTRFRSFERIRGIVEGAFEPRRSEWRCGEQFLEMVWASLVCKWI